MTAQQSQLYPRVTVELMSEVFPCPGRSWKSKKKDAPAKETAFTITQKNRWTPLRASQRAGLVAARVSELGQAGNQLDRTRVVKTLEGLHQRSINTKRSRERSQSSVASVEVGAQVNENIVARSITSLDIQRREASGNTTIAEAGQRVDGIELISPAGYQAPPKN